MAGILEQIKDLEIDFKVQLEKLVAAGGEAASVSEIDQNFSALKNQFLGPRSDLQSLLRSLKDINDSNEKKKIGKEANDLRQMIETKISQKQVEIKTKILNTTLKQEEIEATHPGTPIQQSLTHQHILSKTMEEIEDIFMRMGFDIEYANEVDNAYNTFDALNIPESHPARDSWDTLWLEDGNLIIPHTSAMQNRILRSGEAPIRKIILGKCSRNEATDASHEHTFTQCEGVYLDHNASMSQMLGVLLNFFENFFEQKLGYKFSPDYFPFVEPGGQLAIRFEKKKGGANATDTKANYLEVLGCGMIHPEVLRQAGRDPEKYSGFAWGFGVERMAMIKYNISDIRGFYSNDLRFNQQFI